jgi:hypothetical protein
MHGAPATLMRWVKFDGLSGNQVLLFQALDAFIGLDPYLPARDQECNVPWRQRALCDVFRKHSFRERLCVSHMDDTEAQIAKEFSEIAKRLRVGFPDFPSYYQRPRETE